MDRDREVHWPKWAGRAAGPPDDEERRAPPIADALAAPTWASGVRDGVTPDRITGASPGAVPAGHAAAAGDAVDSAHEDLQHGDAADPGARTPPPAADPVSGTGHPGTAEAAGSGADTPAPDDAGRPATVIAIANQKGGVGKTTTAVSVAAAIAESGAQVLLVDLDPQGNASSGLGLHPRPDQPTVYDVLVDGMDLLDVVRPANVRNLFLAPANIDLAGAEIELVSAFSREQRLRRSLEAIREDYDLIIVDCPPSLGLLTVNALTAADGLLVPIQCEYYALEGLGALRRNADLVRANLNPSLDIIGFVLTMLDGRTRLSQQVVEEVRTHFGDKVFRTRVPRSVRLAEAPGFGQPITVFDSGSRGAMAYRRLARELLDRLDAQHLFPPLAQEGASR